jgi:hypothetical protein
MLSTSYHDDADQSLALLRQKGLPPAGWAYLAAEAVRALNHATLDPSGYPYPGDAYSVIGNLQTLAQRLPQATDQASRYLIRAHAAGSVVDVEDGSRTAPTVLEAIDGLHLAAALAAQLADALGGVHSATGRLASTRQADDDAADAGAGE